MVRVGRGEPDEVRAELERPHGLIESDPELGLLILHELILRGIGLPANADRYVGWGQRNDHPLAALPLELLPLEAGVGARMPRYRATGASLPSVPWPDHDRRVPATDLIPPLGDLLDFDEQLCVAAFQGWMDFAVRRYDRPSIEPDRPAAAIEPEPDEPLPTSLTPAAPIDAPTVFASLVFPWGLDRPSPGGAHARLRAWQTIAGVLDAGWPTDLAELGRRAESVQWIWLDPRTHGWFMGIEDLWLVAVTESHVTVIAGSDSD